jgi:hypothetical protein
MSGLRGSNISRTAGAQREPVPFRNLCNIDTCQISDALRLSIDSINSSTEIWSRYECCVLARPKPRGRIADNPEVDSRMRQPIQPD